MHGKTHFTLKGKGQSNSSGGPLLMPATTAVYPEPTHLPRAAAWRQGQYCGKQKKPRDESRRLLLIITITFYRCYSAAVNTPKDTHNGWVCHRKSACRCREHRILRIIYSIYLHNTIFYSHLQTLSHPCITNTF